MCHLYCNPGTGIVGIRIGTSTVLVRQQAGQYRQLYLHETVVTCFLLDLANLGGALPGFSSSRNFAFLLLVLSSFAGDFTDLLEGLVRLPVNPD